MATGVYYLTRPFPLAQVTDSPLVLDWALRPTPPPHEPPRPGRLAKGSGRLEEKGGGGGGGALAGMHAYG